MGGDRKQIGGHGSHPGKSFHQLEWGALGRKQVERMIRGSGWNAGLRCKGDSWICNSGVQQRGRSWEFDVTNI